MAQRVVRGIALYSSMTAALEGGEWSAARPGRTLPPGKTRYPFYRRLGGPQGRSGRAECVDLCHANLCSYEVLFVGSYLVVVLLNLEAGVTWIRNYCKFPNSEHFQKLRIVQQVTTFPSLKEPKGSKLLKHFIIQQMHKNIIRRYNYSYYEIFKIAPTCFRSQGIHHQGALYSAWLKLL